VRKARPGVRLADALARTLITIGGVGTILAVATLCLFLLWVVVPLFIPARAQATDLAAPRPLVTGGAAVGLGMDEYLCLGWSCSDTGEVDSFRLADGARLESATLPGAAGELTALTLQADGSLLAGYADGTLRSGRIGFTTRTLAPDEARGLEALAEGESARLGAGVVERTSGDQLRLQELLLASDELVPSGADGPLTCVDRVETPAGSVFAALDGSGRLHLGRVTRKKNLLTGKETFAIQRGELALELPAGREPPRWLRLQGQGTNVYLVWSDGTLWRVDCRELGQAHVAEKRDLLEPDDARISALCLLIGRTTLAVGDDRGCVQICFPTRPEGAGTPDGLTLAVARVLGDPGAPVTALAPSVRSRLLAVGRGDGSLRVYHVTSGKELVQLQAPGEGQPVEELALAPKDDALIASTAAGSAVWSLKAPHPETNFEAVFGRVWYEGYAAPEHVWQSSSGTDDFEPKYGMVPLVFGTLKATFYSLLFGVPIALLAALYTSEFLHPRNRARVKPAIEMMASLPSVVLGFLSALILAPWIEDIVPTVLLCIALLPLGALLGGYLWRLLRGAWLVRLERWRLAFVALALLLSLVLGAWLGPPLERLLFAGDFRQWLTGSVGQGTGGWMILLLPLVGLGVALLTFRLVDPWLVSRCRESTRERFALLDLAKFLCAVGFALVTLWALSATLSALGFDPRGGFLATYVQRNALVVGFVMGFAIIPIVYTISEDALAAVPDHLRAASLGAGATPWQTAMRVVVPTAMSGIFSAIMIGFGRAVGETMIVLMAAGNTPILEWNVFNGFRTLSANIAVELPETAQGTTHYRMLFLAALVLFAITFLLNTLAEAVRLRYRKRSVQL